MPSSCFDATKCCNLPDFRVEGLTDCPDARKCRTDLRAEKADAVFSERIRPWTSSWLGDGCGLLRTDEIGRQHGWAMHKDKKQAKTNTCKQHQYQNFNNTRGKREAINNSRKMHIAEQEREGGYVFEDSAKQGVETAAQPSGKNNMTKSHAGRV